MDAMTAGTDSPRGSKRKADESNIITQAPKRIKALDQNVVNKIAAGEIIVAPVHALKELIENAVDAGSTSLEITIKDGGLKLLQITDNGHGINKEDLPILCERFTTSKLKAFEDLSSIGTYGFRGEALASISHIAHLTVTTKTADSSCAWRAQYADGKLVPAKPGQSAEPKPTAGRGGTQIKVEDLFYNVISRQKAFRSPSEEYAKILDVVGRYAIHCNGVAFSCKKQGESAAGISTPSNASTVDSIRQIHGGAVANELISLELDNPKWGFKASGRMTNANYHAKKTTVLLFINHRSVESTAIKRAIEQVYSGFLPKGGKPFVYLSLEIEPQRVDVNVHPTKREVNFLNEDEIIEEVCTELHTKLSSVDTSRTFTTQTLLPGAGLPTSTPSERSSKYGPSSTSKPSSTATSKPYENNLVRTDPNLRKITSMLTPSNSIDTAEDLPNQAAGGGAMYIAEPRPRTDCQFKSIKQLRSNVCDSAHAGLAEIFSALTYVGLVDPTRRIAAVQSGVKLYLVDYGLLASELFYQIGLADFQNFGVIKFDPPLDLTALARVGVEHERERAEEEAAADVEGGEDNTVEFWDSIPPTLTAHLLCKKDMLAEYFNLDIRASSSSSPSHSPSATSQGSPPPPSAIKSAYLHSLPLLLKGYTPFPAKLPRFLLRLGPHVNWNEEMGCFHTFLRELASFYAPPQLSPFPTSTAPSLSTTDTSTAGSPSLPRRRPVAEADEEAEGGETETPNRHDRERRQQLREQQQQQQQQHDQLNHTLEHVLIPALRSRLVATQGMLKGVVEVADLKGLYRVFERC